MATLRQIALILGISGQDGSYLARELLLSGFEVHGTTRQSDHSTSNFDNLTCLGIYQDIFLHTIDASDYQAIYQHINHIQPTHIYHLAGLTSVAYSFEEPLEAIRSIILSTSNLLESVRHIDPNIHVFIPVSTDCFGEVEASSPADERTRFNPLSPYAVSKSAVHSIAETYRSLYDMHVSVGILSNHESPLRGQRFVTQKILRELNLILNTNPNHRIALGDIDIVRDWGWAPDYTAAMKLISTSPSPDTYIIATGQSASLRTLIQDIFVSAGIDNFEKHITVSNKLYRPNEIKHSYLNPSKIQTRLGWTPTTRNTKEIAEKLTSRTLL